jgi:NitT/TauT family transport system substrate-binding protein
VQSNQEEVAKLQLDKNYVAGTIEVNSVVLKKLNYIPSATGAYEAFAITAPHLQRVGMLSEDINVAALQKNSFEFFKGLDDEYK